MEAMDTMKLKKFPVVVQTDCKNINRIYPLKQQIAADLYEVAQKFDEIKKIYIFGSSVTPQCGIDSDIDICIDADVSDGMRIFNMQSEIGKLCDWNCDIIMYCNIGTSLKETIRKEGVVIYEQSA
ncbi:MAG: nucleotidyltransferase domain-containing protein [Clostridia bacterium]